jgi:hypothetical protein
MLSDLNDSIKEATGNGERRWMGAGGNLRENVNVTNS